jgi:hypothetical protein
MERNLNAEATIKIVPSPIANSGFKICGMTKARGCLPVSHNKLQELRNMKACPIEIERVFTFSSNISPFLGGRTRYTHSRNGIPSTIKEARIKKSMHSSDWNLLAHFSKGHGEVAT